MALTVMEKDLYKRINLYQKETFREFLLNAITTDDEEAFAQTVKIIGNQWGVLRTVVMKDSDTDDIKNEEKISKESFSHFTKRLWNNRLGILSGDYSEWTADARPHSYESKICFLLNPLHYKIIYDSHNRRALGRPNCKPSEWQALVNSYFENKKPGSLSINECFLNDCNLWLKGWPEK